MRELATEKLGLLVILACIVANADSQATNREIQSLGKRNQDAASRRFVNSKRKTAIQNIDFSKNYMTSEQYIEMLNKYLKDNKSVVDYDLSGQINGIQAELGYMRSVLDAFSGNTGGNRRSAMKIDFSYPSIMAYVRAKLSQEGQDFGSKEPEQKKKEIEQLKPNEALNIGHLLWIIDHFEHYIENIEQHEEKIKNEEIKSNGRFNFGLTKEDINLILNLTVGETNDSKRVFNIHNLEENDRETFRESLKWMLGNATGFQRVLSLLVMSTYNNKVYNPANPKDQRCWQMEIRFTDKGGSYWEPASFKLNVDIDEVKNIKTIYDKEISYESELSLTIFHEMTHSFQSMMGLNHSYTLIPNASFINSGTAGYDYLDQYFPMFRKQVMRPIVEQIKKILKIYFGEGFTNLKTTRLTKDEKKTLCDAIFEPTIRSIMMLGFGRLIFPDYSAKSPNSISLEINAETLTLERIAVCLYVSGVLEYPIKLEFDNEKKVIIHTTGEATSNSIAVYHKEDNKYWNNLYESRFKSNDFWDNYWEHLGMQGSAILISNWGEYQIEDRQHEQIYYIREKEENITTPQPFSSYFRYHAVPAKNLGFYLFDRILDYILKCCPSVEYFECRDRFKEDYVKNNLFNIWYRANFPLQKEKYGIEGKQLDYKELHFAEKNTTNYSKLKEICTGSVENLNEAQLEQLKSHMNEGNDLGQTILFYAVEKYSLKVVESLCNLGADPFIVDLNGKNLMHYAIKNPNYEKIMDFLVEKGLEIDDSVFIEIPKPRNGNADDQKDQKSRIEYLIKKRNKNINEKDFYGNTLLDNLVQYRPFDMNFFEMVFNCIKEMYKQYKTDSARGTSTNLKTVFQDTKDNGPIDLHVTLSSIKNKEIATFLETQIADNKISLCIEEELFEDAPLLFASKYNCRKMVELLLNKGANINAKDNDGQTPLHCAAIYGHNEIAELLINKRAPIEAKDNMGLTPLHYAAAYGRNDMAELLINNGAQIEAKDNIGQTPLHVAAMSKSTSMAELLINNGAQIEARDNIEQTPLHVAIENNFQSMVELLISKRADVKARDNKGNTPLHIAAMNNSLKVVEKLLSEGADVNATDNDMKTPLHIAAAINDSLDVVEKLIENGAQIDAKDKNDNTPLHIATRYNSLVALCLITKGADISAENSFRNTPLHIAVEIGNKDLMMLFIDNKANINATNIEAQTPLHIAARYNSDIAKSKEITKLLIDRGANIDAGDIYGQTPLHVAAQYSKDIAEIIVNEGANINIKDNNGRTPLHVAAEEGLHDIVKLLIDRCVYACSNSCKSKLLSKLFSGTCSDACVKAYIDATDIAQKKAIELTNNEDIKSALSR